MDNNINIDLTSQKHTHSGLNAKIYKEKLEAKIKTLKRVCDTLDPYNEMSAEVKEELTNLGITDLDNPFTLTNQLLFQMENAIEELHNL